MPNKIDVNILIGKRNNAVQVMEELCDEFETIFQVQPQLDTLKLTFDHVQSKYRSIQKQTEAIADKLVEDKASPEDERVSSNQLIGKEARAKYLQIARLFAAYQKDQQQPPSVPAQAMNNSDAIQAMTIAVKEMAESLRGAKPNSGSGLERLPVPSWDGNRRTYNTWKKEFSHWMSKYHQDKDEQLQRFRRAMPTKGFWWTEQTKTCKSIDEAFSILDIEFGDKRKLMDELLAEINNHKQVRRDAKSLSQYSTVVSSFVNDMKDNGCCVLKSPEAPFFMSQLLSKLDPLDNADFGREMHRQEKEENVTNLVDWLRQEASFRSRGNRVAQGSQSKSENHAVSTGTTDQEVCQLGCTTKHHLAACPVYQGLSVNEKWEAVKKHNACRKCLRSHHTKHCKKPDGSTCDKCDKNHHHSLHNEKREEVQSTLNVDAPVFAGPSTSQSTASEHHSIQGDATDCQRQGKSLTGLCPIQKVKIKSAHGEFVDALAMLDTGSNTSLLSKNMARKLGVSGSQTQLTMNLAGGKKKTEVSESFEIIVAPPTDIDIQKNVHVYTVTRPCSSAKTVSKKAIEEYPHLKPIVEKLHLAGGTVDLLIGTDFSDAFLDLHSLSGDPGEPIAKRNCFGWYTLGRLESSFNEGRIQSTDVSFVDTSEDIKKLLYQDQVGIKPTQLCTRTDDILRENFGDKPAPDIASNSITTITKA